MFRTTIALMAVGLMVSLVSVASANHIAVSGYIGGDAQGGSPHADWNPVGAGSTMHTDSGNGTAGWGTRSPQRTVNGHEVTAGGAHGRGTQNNGGDPGWLGSFNSNANNPVDAGVGDNWLSYEFDSEYNLGSMYWANWGNPAGFGPPNHAGGIKDVKVHYSSGGGSYTHLGDFTIPQAPGGAQDLAPLGDFQGAAADKVVITILNSYDTVSGGSAATTYHGLGAWAVDVVVAPVIPEPTSITILGIGLGMLLVGRRQRRS